MKRFVALCAETEVAEGGQKLVRIESKAILVCRSEGEVFALENRCTHDNEPLLGGTLKKCTIVCPMHGARFHLKTGAPLAGPAFEPLTLYETRINSGWIEAAL
jgi:3-phenylpropionate/trans-cinnamate dioxygenase ferredoxin subunit